MKFKINIKQSVWFKRLFIVLIILIFGFFVGLTIVNDLIYLNSSEQTNADVTTIDEEKQEVVISYFNKYQNKTILCILTEGSIKQEALKGKRVFKISYTSKDSCHIYFEGKGNPTIITLIFHIFILLLLLFFALIPVLKGKSDDIAW